MLPASNSHTILPVPLLAGSYGTEGSEPLEWTLRLRLRASPVRNKTAFLSDVVASRDHLPRQPRTDEEESFSKETVGLRIGFTHWFHALVSRIGFTQAVADVSIVSGGCYMGGGIKNASGWFGAYYIPCPGDSSKLAKVGEVKLSF
jgi:hypothetical protein